MFGRPVRPGRGSPVSTQGPSWGYLKVNFSETLSIFGDKRRRNGSKNGEMAPRTGTGYPHIGPCVAMTGGERGPWGGSRGARPRSALSLSHTFFFSLSLYLSIYLSLYLFISIDFGLYLSLSIPTYHYLSIYICRGPRGGSGGARPQSALLLPLSAEADSM